MSRKNMLTLYLSNITEKELYNSLREQFFIYKILNLVSILVFEIKDFVCWWLAVARPSDIANECHISDMTHRFMHETCYRKHAFLKKWMNKIFEKYLNHK